MNPPDQLPLPAASTGTESPSVRTAELRTPRPPIRSLAAFRALQTPLNPPSSQLIIEDHEDRF